MKSNHLLFIIFFSISPCFSQNVSINGTGAVANTSAGLDVDFTNKGMLLPRVYLTARNNNAPIGAAVATSLLVYNLTNSGSGINDVTPGYYYWDGTIWQRITNGGGNDWNILGNTGTQSATNFLGTTDNMALTFRTFNVEKLKLSTKGQIETLNMGNSVLIGQGAGNSDDLSDNRNILIGNLTNTGAGNEQNVIIGHTAYTTANNTTTIGYAAISGANNAVVYGHSAQATGIQSMAIGNLAIVNTLGAMAIGKSANAQGDYGIALGNTAYTNNVRGIALGAEANSQALNGIAIGYQSYSTNPNTISIGTLASAQSERGIAIGYDSYTGNQFTTAIGNNAEAQGNNSIAIGSASRTYAATSTAVGNAATANGTNATAYGNSANANSGDATALGNSSFANGANGTAIGNGASCAGNQVRIGNNAVTSIGGFANWTNVSDARVKTNVKKNIPGLNFIMMLEPVSYNLDLEAINRIQRKNSPTFSTADSVKMKEIQTGFLAQDVEKAAKSINYEFSGIDAPDNENDTYGIRYAEFVVPLVKGMQEQQQLILEMKKEIENLKKEILITKQK